MEVNLSPAQRRGDVGAGRAPGATFTLGPAPNPAKGQVTAVSNLMTGSE